MSNPVYGDARFKGLNLETAALPGRDTGKPVQATKSAERAEGSRALTPVILLGGDNNVLSAARSLSKLGIAVYTINHDRAPARHSRHARWISAGPQNSPGDWHKLLTDGRLDHLRGAVLLCCSDDAIELVNANYEQLSKLFKLELCSPGIRGQFLDKLTTYESAVAASIPCPRFWLLQCPADLERAAAECTYPVIVKPRLSHQWELLGGKYIKIENEADLRSQFARCVKLGVASVAMEFLPGDDSQNCSYYTYIDDGGVPLVHFTKRLLRRYPALKGGATYHITGWDPEVADLGLKFFRQAGLKGLLNVEFKRDPRDNRLKLIEVNARFTAGNEIVTASGIDLPAIAYNNLTGRLQKLPTSFTEDLVMCDVHQDFLAFLERRRRNELTLIEWLRQLSHVNVTPVFKFTDPLPGIFSILHSAALAKKAALKRVNPARTNGAPASSFGARLTNKTIISSRCGAEYARRLLNGRVSAGTRSMWAARREFYVDIWRHAAEINHARFKRLDAAGSMTVTRDGKVLDVFVNEPHVDSKKTIERSGDKLLVHHLLQGAGIPVPRHAVVTAGNFEPAIRFLAESRNPVVVKPAAGTGGGSGVSTNVTTLSELRAALARALTFGRDVLIEEQVEGDCYRILLMDGEVIDCIVRFPPAVTGDGISTIRNLIGAENRRRAAMSARRSQVFIGFDPDLSNTLRRQGLTLSDCPADGAIIRLKQAINENALHENASAMGTLCPAILETARTAARLAGVRLCGVDVICRDPSQPLQSTGGVVLEVNAPPGLYYHYIHSSTSGVADEILRRYLGGTPEAPRAEPMQTAHCTRGTPIHMNGAHTRLAPDAQPLTRPS